MKTVLVALQMNAADETVLAWSRVLCQRFGAERLVLLGLDERLAMEAEIAAYLPELLEEAPPVADLLDYLEERRKLCASWAPQVETELRRGEAWKEVLAASREIAADLLVLPRSLGNDDDLDGATMAARRVVRKAPCEVLCVGSAAPGKLLRALVPIDFSERSLGALRVALRFVRGTSGRVTAMHVFRVPRGAATKPIDMEEIAARLERGLLERIGEIVAAEPASDRERLEASVVQSPQPVPAVIAETARANAVELLCIGSRGRTPLAALALGSVAEGVLERSPIALYVHKEKGETLGLLDALGI
ncbi:MAG: universal stress protein [Planctomycetes bacterium]|nr:universal stress protein [Planctomycetota bacterium]